MLNANICDNISENDLGHLTFAGQDTAELAAKYGTPLYLMDEDRVRYNCRIYRNAFRKYFGGKAAVLYASKANCFKQICRIAQEEGMLLDVVSCGELYTALQAGFAPGKIYFHSNNKTDADIREAIGRKVGWFVVDSADEIGAIEREASRQNVRQKILLRLTPGIDTHTYAAVNTGLVDSKFGTAIETGQAAEIVEYTLRQPHIELSGFHCHVGSQVFAENVFERSAVVMLEFIAQMRDKLGYAPQQLGLGGGYGVRYVSDDPYIDIGKKISDVAETVFATCERLKLDVPMLLMEPGRSIVADAGMTLYTVGTVKRIPGYKNYVSVDGGMSDNPRFALYGSRYTCYAAERMRETCDMKADLVGRCCESGDVIQPDVMFPETVRRGDLVAVCTTGAYNYSMASNYNRIPRPPVVMLRGGESYIAVKRETWDDLVRLDV